jgi:ribosomal protein S25
MKRHFIVLLSVLFFFGCNIDVDKCHVYSNDIQSEKIVICQNKLLYEYIKEVDINGPIYTKYDYYEIIEIIAKEKYDVFIIKEKELYTFIIRYVFRDKRKYNVSFYLSDVRNENKKEAIESFEEYRKEAIYWSQKVSNNEVRIPLNLLRFREINE